MKVMKLRKLTSPGIEKFSEYIKSFALNSPLDYPEYLLENDAYSAEMANIEISPRLFKSRFEAGEYLYNTLSSIKSDTEIEDQGLWCWLSLYYFKQLCPKYKNRKLPSIEKIIPKLTDFQKYYRHLLYGPYKIFQFHKGAPENAMPLLCGEIFKFSELAEQIASRQELVTNKSLMSAIYNLYYDESTLKLKRGSGGKGKGTPRRLASIIEQFSLTWDLYSMSPKDILSLLPKEFDRFKD